MPSRLDWVNWPAEWNDAPETATRAEILTWSAGLPPAVQVVVFDYPPWRQYQMNGHEGALYRVVSYDEPEEKDAPITVTVEKPISVRLLGSLTITYSVLTHTTLA